MKNRYAFLLTIALPVIVLDQSRIVAMSFCEPRSW